MNLTLPGPHDTILRPALARRIEGAATGGLVAVVAGAGFGKTTALRTWAEAHPHAWHTCTGDDLSATQLARSLVNALRLRVPALPTRLVPPEPGPRPTLAPVQGVDPYGYAATLAGALDAVLEAPLTLIIDDLHELGAEGASIALLDAFTRGAPSMLRVVVASRLPLPFAVERLRAQDRLREIDAADLAFSPEEVETLLEAVLDDSPGPQLTDALHAATGGWPVVVRLAADHLRRVPPGDRGSVVQQLLSVDGPLLDSLDVVLLAGGDPAATGALQRLAHLPWLSPALCRAVGIEEPGPLLRDLAHRGILRPAPRPVGTDELLQADAGMVMVPVVRALVVERLPLDPGLRAHVRRLAAKWFQSERRYAEALTCLVEAADEDAVAALLREHGTSLLQRGEAPLVCRAVASLPGPVTEPALQLLLADAHQQGGDWEEAQRLYDAVDDGGPLSAGLAWRIGSLAYQRGDLPLAVSVYRRAAIRDADTADEALVLAWLAAASFRQGDIAGCEEATTRALAAATAAREDVASAAAHTAAAMLAALRGDRAANDHHYLLALDAATRAGDVSQIVRIRTNRSSSFVEQGLYREGRVEATLAIQLSEGTGVTAFLGMALINRGDAHRHLGRLEEAVADYEAARSWFQRLGSTPVSLAVLGLADVHRARGQRASALARYREAVQLAEPVGDHHVLVPALTGLSWALREEDPTAALACAGRAVAMGPGMGLVAAMTALAAAQLAIVDVRAARSTANAALEEAGRRRDRRGMAHALELRARADPGSPMAEVWLSEAVDLWRGLHSPRGTARATLALAHHSTGPRRQVLASSAAGLFTDLGLGRQAMEAEQVARPHDGPSTAVGVQALGSFRVLRAGRPVPTGEWGSRKARDLLKVLVARRGRAVARDHVAGLLWPDEEPKRTAGRLSVQLSTLRTVLDPQRAHPADHYVVADGDTIRLELQTVAVDVEAFLALADDALHRVAVGDPSSTGQLARAEAAYTGDVLESDVFEDWAGPLREEARATYLEVARALAAVRAAEGDTGTAGRMYRRILEHDPYDEAAHLGLVGVLSASGRHGEARRCYAAYTAAMADLGLEPGPFPRDARGPGR